jgi:hypothetical protein
MNYVVDVNIGVSIKTFRFKQILSTVFSLRDKIIKELTLDFQRLNAVYFGSLVPKMCSINFI